MPGILESFLITFMFLVSGIYKVIDYTPTVAGLVTKMQQVWNISLNLQVARVAIAIAAVLQIVSPLVILWTSSGQAHNVDNVPSWNTIAKWACLGLAGFTVAATLVYHFPPYGRTYYPFISNVTTFGALILLANSF